MATAPALPSSRRITVPGVGSVLVREHRGPHADAVPVILLHGWTVSADLNWFACYEHLGRHRRVIAYDQRGHGEGFPRHGRFRFSECADDVIAVADGLGIDRFIVVGYSMGGCIAQLVARRRPERLHGAVFSATCGRFRGSGRERARFALLRPAASVARRLPRSARAAAFERLLEIDALHGGLDGWALDEIAKANPQALLEAGTELYDFDSLPWLHQLRLPTAVVVTERDTSVPPDRQHRLAAALPDCTTHTVAGGHAVVVSRPQQFLPALDAALASVTHRADGLDADLTTAKYS